MRSFTRWTLSGAGIDQSIGWMAAAEDAQNQQVEATAPSRCRLVRDAFYNVLVPGGAALPGAVPHLGRSAAARVCTLAHTTL
jgi:hypothetical protein